MADTIFKKILSGEIPSHKIYEDNLVYAFLDINPLSKGHTLVIPKEPAETLDELSEESSAAIGKVLPKICKAVQQVSGCSHYNVLQNNGHLAHQAVYHVHFHIIPKFEEKDGLGIEWPAKALSLEEGEQLSSKLRDCLSK